MEHNYYRDLSAETAGESVPEWLKKQKRSEDRRERKTKKKNICTSYTRWKVLMIGKKFSNDSQVAFFFVGE